MTAAIAAMEEPSVLDYRRAVIAQMFLARSLMTTAHEGAKDGIGEVSLCDLQQSSMLIQSALVMLKDVDAGVAAFRMRRLMLRAISAADAASNHVKHQMHYRNGNTKLEVDQLHRLRKIWKKSAEESCKEAHRALAFLCERFPEAFESIPEGQG